MSQVDWTKSKPSVIDCLISEVQLHERSIELALSTRRYSIHKREEDFQASLNLTRDRLALKRGLLEQALERSGGLI